MKYFKLYVSLTDDELAKGIRAAHQNGLRAIAHLDRVSWTRAAELGIDDLTHALPTSPDLLEPELRREYVASLGADSKFMYRWFELVDLDGPLMQQLIDLLVKKQIRVDLTLVVNELVYNVDNIERVFPIEERRYSHPAVREAGIRQLKASATGWTEDDFRRARAVMPRVLQFARRLYEAGVPLIIGTDGHGGTRRMPVNYSCMSMLEFQYGMCFGSAHPWVLSVWVLENGPGELPSVWKLMSCS